RSREVREGFFGYACRGHLGGGSATTTQTFAPFAASRWILKASPWRMQADHEAVADDGEAGDAERDGCGPEFLALRACRHRAQHHARLQDDERALEPVPLPLVEAFVGLDRLRLGLRLDE